MDDLSFEEFEIEYKYLKAVIEGGLESKPDNILIYATSNRRHLVRERAGDKLEVGADDDIHSSDTVQEKLSLVYRFGVRIYFWSTGPQRIPHDREDTGCSSWHSDAGRPAASGGWKVGNLSWRSYRKNGTAVY